MLTQAPGTVGYLPTRSRPNHLLYKYLGLLSTWTSLTIDNVVNIGWLHIRGTGTRHKRYSHFRIVSNHLGLSAEGAERISSYCLEKRESARMDLVGST